MKLGRSVSHVQAARGDLGLRGKEELVVVVMVVVVGGGSGGGGVYGGGGGYKHNNETGRYPSQHQMKQTVTA